MAKTGTFLQVPSDQEGATPRLVIESSGLPVKILNLDGENAAEQYSKAIRVIESEHGWLHDGKAFVTGHFFTGVADNASVEMLIEPTSAMHALFRIACSGSAEVHFFEGTTKTTGTELTTFNKNRLSSTVSGATISHTPGGTGDGTEFPPSFIPGGRGGNAAGGSGEGYGREFIFNSAEDYLLRIINRGGNGARISLKVEHYEPGA